MCADTRRVIHSGQYAKLKKVVREFISRKILQLGVKMANFSFTIRVKALPFMKPDFRRTRLPV